MEKNTTYYKGIGDYMRPSLQHFRRPEADEHAQNYVAGLMMMEGERKSVESRLKRQDQKHYGILETSRAEWRAAHALAA